MYKQRLSPPIRGRGLKRRSLLDRPSQLESPPIRGRGLKLWKGRGYDGWDCRPPYGGVD